MAANPDLVVALGPSASLEGLKRGWDEFQQCYGDKSRNLTDAAQRWHEYDTTSARELFEREDNSKPSPFEGMISNICGKPISFSRVYIGLSYISDCWVTTATLSLGSTPVDVWPPSKEALNALLTTLAFIEGREWIQGAFLDHAEGFDLSSDEEEKKSLPIEQYNGNLGGYFGGIIASWFVFNPNGPTAFAVGYVEIESRLRLFYRWLHFTGGKTYLLDDLGRVSDAISSQRLEEALLDSLIRFHSYMISQGNDLPLFGSLPSFIKLDGNPHAEAAIRWLISNNPSTVEKDWGRELYLLRKYSGNLFDRAAEEIRETYEKLSKEADIDPQISKEGLQWTWQRHAHIASFATWTPHAYQSASYSEAAFEEWWSTICTSEFETRSLIDFAQAWVGKLVSLEGRSLDQSLREEGKLTTFDDFAQFFEDFQMPLYPDHWNSAYVAKLMGL